MAKRIVTIKHLQAIVDNLNRLTKQPMTTYTKNSDGTFTNNYGCYFLDNAYGGYKLVQMLESGEHNVLSTGYLPKPLLAQLIHSYIQGIRDAMDQLVRPWEKP